MAQFTCEICGDGFEQKSRFKRHMATSHPEKAAPSAADIEKALSGIQHPRTKEELISYASGRVSDEELMNMIRSLPTREYRDSADVAIALGEVKRKQGIRRRGRQDRSAKCKGRESGGNHIISFSRCSCQDSFRSRLSKE